MVKDLFESLPLKTNLTIRDHPVSGRGTHELH